MDKTGNTILVTGATSGIGLELARAFRKSGNRVIIAGRRAALLDALVAQEPEFAAYPLDVTDPAAITALAATLRADHPTVNVLVNNAGIMLAEDLTDPAYSLAQAEAMVDTNLLGPIRLTAALLPQLRAQSRSAVLNVTSGLAFVPLAITPTYNATKAALHSWTQSLRMQLRNTTTEVVEIAPPAVQTDLMPGSATNPHYMPLADFIAETMAILHQVPTPAEVCVERVMFLRRAEAEGRYDETLRMLNRLG